MLLAMTVLPGCNGVYYDDVPVTVGRWVLVESDGMPVPEAYADYYDFFENGDGLHSYYDYYGRFVSDPFVWDIRRPGELYIRYLDYSIGSYFLYYDYDGAYLYLSAGNMFLLILQDIGYDNDNIRRILHFSPSALRVARFRIKNKMK